MTILVAVRTGSAVVMAADSKLSTQAPMGLDSDGSPIWGQQTYDHAVKITQDASSTAIAAFCGYASIGEQYAVDYFARQDLKLYGPRTEQDHKVAQLAHAMHGERRRSAELVEMPLEQIPATIILLAAPPSEGVAPRVWRIVLAWQEPEVTEILPTARAWFEGAVDDTITLFYGLERARLEPLRARFKIENSPFDEEVASLRRVAPANRINFWTMPIQDAIDFAVFAAEVQVEMDRFLPGFGNCGGPIDVMTLEMSPKPTIRSFPGKSLRHPHGGR